jgi:hypothetical protein
MRQPLGSRDPGLRVTTHSLPVSAVVGIAVAGAIVAVVGAWWLRSRTLPSFERVLGSRERSERAYVLTVWALVILLGILYNALGLMPLPVGVGLSLGSALAVLGLLWPPYMQDPKFGTTQHLVQRVVVTFVGVILLILAAGHAG